MYIIDKSEFLLNDLYLPWHEFQEYEMFIKYSDNGNDIN